MCRQTDYLKNTYYAIFVLRFEFELLQYEGVLILAEMRLSKASPLIVYIMIYTVRVQQAIILSSLKKSLKNKLKK